MTAARAIGVVAPEQKHSTAVLALSNFAPDITGDSGLPKLIRV
jgi:hypothetical protein